MITTAQASEFVDAKLGIAALAFEIRTACDAVEVLEAAMAAAGYSEWKVQRVQCLAVAIMVGTGARAINSQGAPSGASRSFKNRDAALSEMRRELANLDTAGIVAELVGPDPTNATLLMVV